ncbi:hypothetical protein AAF712_014731 [Marasmius tenuissimus]|uniref:Uncharacterized protein n=1 Tax=Marasmius tenuissimus TaxID=585030 RepID=A0ABR2ZB55_9AGAR
MAKRPAEHFHSDRVRVILSSEEILQQQGRSERSKMVARRRQDELRTLRRRVKEHETEARRYCKQAEDCQSELNRMGMQHEQIKLYYESQLTYIRKEYERGTDNLMNAPVQDAAKWSNEVLARLFWETLEERRKTQAELNSVKARLGTAEGIIDDYRTRSEMSIDLEHQSRFAVEWATPSQYRASGRPFDRHRTLDPGSEPRVDMLFQSEERAKVNPGNSPSIPSVSNDALVVQADDYSGSRSDVVEPLHGKQKALISSNLTDRCQPTLSPLLLTNQGPKAEYTSPEDYHPTVRRISGEDRGFALKDARRMPTVAGIDGPLSSAKKETDNEPISQQYLRDVSLPQAGSKVLAMDLVSKPGSSQGTPPVSPDPDPASTLELPASAKDELPVPTRPSISETALPIPTSVKEEISSETSDVVMVVVTPTPNGSMAAARDSDSGMGNSPAGHNTLTTASVSPKQSTLQATLSTSVSFESSQPVLFPGTASIPSHPNLPSINLVGSISAGRKRTKICTDDGTGAPKNLWRLYYIREASPSTVYEASFKKWYQTLTAEQRKNPPPRAALNTQ